MMGEGDGASNLTLVLVPQMHGMERGTYSRIAVAFPLCSGAGAGAGPVAGTVVCSLESALGPLPCQLAPTVDV